MTNTSMVKVKLDSAELPSQAIVNAAKNLHVQHFTITSDAMYKRCFVQGVDDESLRQNRTVLVRAIKDLVVRMGEKNYDVAKEAARGMGLAQGNITEIEMIQEALTDSQTSLRLSSAQREEKLGKVPEFPKVDFACKVAWDNAERERCIIGAEMQVRNDEIFSMRVRLPYYGHMLAKLFPDVREISLEEREKHVLQVLEAAFCMWDKNVRTSETSTSENWTSIHGTPRDELGNSYPNVPYPVCCVEIFLGKCVNVLEHLMTKIRESNWPKEVKTPQRRAVFQFESQRKEKQGELKSKFEAMYGRRYSIDKLRNFFKKKLGEENYSIERKNIGGLKETDCLTLEEKKFFEILENYELFEMFLVGNVTTEEEVNNEVISHTIRSLYMNTAITEDSVEYDAQQSGSVWLSSSYLKDYKEIDAKGKAFSAINCTKKSQHRIGDDTYRLVKQELENLFPDDELRSRIAQCILETKDDDEIYTFNNAGDLVVVPRGIVQSVIYAVARNEGKLPWAELEKLTPNQAVHHEVVNFLAKKGYVEFHATDGSRNLCTIEVAANAIVREIEQDKYSKGNDELHVLPVAILGKFVPDERTRECVIRCILRHRGYKRDGDGNLLWKKIQTQHPSQSNREKDISSSATTTSQSSNQPSRSRQVSSTPPDNLDKQPKNQDKAK